MNIDENELVMFKNDKSDVIQSGGYKINSILKKYNTPIMRSLNTNSEGGESNKSKKDKISSIYDELAVPAGLLYLQDISKKIVNNNDIVANMNDLNKNSINMDNIKYNKKDLIDDSLYDKLFKLASSSVSMSDEDILKAKAKNNSKTKSRNIKPPSKSTTKSNNRGNSNVNANSNNKSTEKNKNKKTKRVRFSKYNKTKRFYK